QRRSPADSDSTSPCTATSWPRGAIFTARAEPLPTGWSHTNNVARALRADAANRVQPVLRAVAFYPNLMFRGTPNHSQLLVVRRAMLRAMVIVGEIRLRGQSLFDDAS